MRSPSVFDKGNQELSKKHNDIKHEDVEQVVETEMGTNGRKNIRRA